MSNQILVNTSTLSPLADAVRTATGETDTMSAAETIAKSTTIVENGGSAVASVNGKIGVVELNYTDVGAPPSSRTINGKSLEEDITLTAQDVGAPTTEDIVELETQVTTNTTAIDTLDSRTGNHADAIMALQNEVDEHTLQSEIMFSQRDRVPNLVDNSNFSVWFGGTPIENALTITEGPTKWYGNGNLYRTYSKISKGCRITTNTSGTYVGIQQRVPATKLHAGAYTIIWNFTTSADCVSYQRNTITANTPTTEIVHVTITDEHITRGYYSIGSCGIYSLADGSDIPEGFYFDVENVAMYEGTYTLDNYPTYIEPNIRLEAIKCGVPLNPPNLLVNSWFVNPVNLRGSTELSTDSDNYFIDRWAGYQGTFSLVNNGIQIQANHQYGALLQQFVQKLEDGVYTFVSKVDGSIVWRVVQISGNTVTTLDNSNAAYSDGAGYLYVQTQDDNAYNFYFRVNVGYTIVVEWAALYKGFYTADTLPAYVVPNKRVEMIRCGVPLNPHNLLDNSWFVNPVHQRGAAEYTGLNTYTIDRWYVGGNNNKVTIGNGCVKVETTVGSSYATIAQKVANCTQYAGKTLTFVARVRSNVIPRIYVYNGDTGIKAVAGTSGDYQVLVCTFTVPSDITEGALSMKIQSKSTTVGDYIEAQWAALYEGAYTAETLPQYQYKGYAAELTECQRYYENSWFGGNTYRQNQTMGYAVDSTRLDSYINFKQSKRIAATITLKPYNPDTYTKWLYYKGGYQEASAMTTVNRCGNIGFMVRLTAKDGDALTAGNCYAMEGHWEASADL